MANQLMYLLFFSQDGWLGFHRIERIMWQDNTTEGTTAYAYADQLVNDIKELKAKIATVKVTPRYHVDRSSRPS